MTTATATATATTATIQRGLLGMDYAPSTDRVTCNDNDDEHECPNCGNTVDRDECTKNPDGDLWCEDCINDECMWCERCEESHFSTDSVEVITTNGYGSRRRTAIWCESCADNHGFKCDDCGDYHLRDNAITISGGDDICQGCYEDGYFTCEGCDEVFQLDDMAGNTRNGCYCNDCGAGEGDFDPSGFRNRSGSVTKIGSARCYGIELETDECNGYFDLEDSAAWGAKDDPTCDGKEFYSDILDGDEGLDAIKEWGEIADDKGWCAGSSCGYHLHLDIRGDSDGQRFAIAYAYRATEAVWLSFAESRRATGSYSHKIGWSCADIAMAYNAGRSYHDWMYRTDRYSWANFYAFNCHETIEIRLHQGTCDEDEVINWVKAHTRFADWAATKGYAGVVEALNGLTNAEKFDLIANEAWQDDDLREYYNDKAEKYTGNTWD